MFKKEDLLKKVQNFKKMNNGPKDNVSLDKDALISEFKKNVEPKADGKSDFLNKVHKNTELHNELTMKNEWKPRTSIKDIHQKIMIESSLDRKPNVFRLNLESLVLDKMNTKFKITRGNESVLVEVMYPNANEKISLKFQLKNVEDRIDEIGLEDEEYTKNFSLYILKTADDMIKEKRATQPSMSDVEQVDGVVNKVSTSDMVTGYSPIWESTMALVEADDLENKDQEPSNEDDNDLEAFFSKAGGSEDSVDADNVNSEDFGADDFALDSGETKLSGFGSGDMGGLGDLGGGGESSGKDVNKDASGTSVGQSEDAPDYMSFREKSNWSNDALNSMQNLVAADVSKKMTSGSGVVLTQDEIVNGTAGIKGDTNHDIIDKFLKVYKELDGIEMQESMLDQIEDKLELDDQQFDSWLQAKLPEITGATEVDETLNNDMFDEFKPMGGETQKPVEEGKGETLADFLSSIKETGSTETQEDQGFRDEVEGETTEEIKNEFPNLS